MPQPPVSLLSAWPPRSLVPALITHRQQQVGRVAFQVPLPPGRASVTLRSPPGSWLAGEFGEELQHTFLGSSDSAKRATSTFPGTLSWRIHGKGKRTFLPPQIPGLNIASPEWERLFWRESTSGWGKAFAWWNWEMCPVTFHKNQNYPSNFRC